MTFADVYWTLWLLIGFAAFETYALVSGHLEWTFTFFFCRVFALFPEHKGKPFWRVRRFAACAVAAWLALHMLTQTMGGLF